MAIGEYEVEFLDLWAVQEPQRFVIGATMNAYRNGRLLGEERPRMNIYPSNQQPIATPAVKSSLTSDLYLTLMAFDQQEGAHATIRAIVNPGVPWLWIGGMIVALGAILAVMPQRGGRRPAVSAAALEREDEGQEWLKRALDLNPWLSERHLLKDPPGEDL